MKKIYVLLALFFVLAPFIINSIYAQAYDYNYGTLSIITNNEQFKAEKPNIKKLYLIDDEDELKNEDFYAKLSESYGISLEENDFIAVANFNDNRYFPFRPRPPYFTQLYSTNDQSFFSDPNKAEKTAYFFNTSKDNTFSFDETVGTFNFANYITSYDCLSDYFRYFVFYKDPGKNFETPHERYLSYKIYIKSLYKHHTKKGFFEFRKLDNNNRYTPQTTSRPKSIFNYAYPDTELDDNFNLKTTGNRTLFASYAITKFHTYISQQEQRYLDYFKTIKPTRQDTEYKAFSYVNINGKTVRVPWFSSPLNKTEGTLYYDINGNLALFFNDKVLSEVKAKRQEHFSKLPMVRNIDIKSTDKFLDPNDLYPNYAKNYEEAKTKPFPTSIEEFTNTIDTSKIEVKNPDTGSWSSWDYWKKYIQIGKVYEIREKNPDKETLIKISFVSKEKLERESWFDGRTHQNKLENLQFGKIVGNYKSLEFGHTPFGDIAGVYGIDYYLEMYYSATDNSYDYKKYENISDEYFYIDDVYEYEITKHGYYVFRLFNSLTNEVKEYRLHYAPLVDAKTTETNTPTGNYHYTEHSIKNVLPHINDLDTYDVYYSPSAEITQNNFHSHTKLTQDDFGNPISPNQLTYKFFKQGFYLVKYKAKTEDTYKFTKFEIKAQDLKYEFYNGTDKLDGSQLSPAPIYTNKPFKLTVHSPKEHWQLEVWKLNSQTNEWSKIPGKWNDKYISNEGIFKLKIINFQAYEEFEQIFNKSNVSPTFELTNAQNDTKPNTYISGTNPVLTLKNTEYQLTVQNSTTGQTLVQNEHRDTFEFTTQPDTITEYLVKITDKYGNFVEFTVKVDKILPKLDFTTTTGQPITPKLNHLGYQTYDNDLKLTKKPTDKIRISKNNQSAVEYHGEKLTHGFYTGIIENKLGLKNIYKFAIYTTFNSISTIINKKTYELVEKNPTFYSNSNLPNQFTFANLVYWRTLTVYQIKDGKEIKLFEQNTQFMNSLLVQELAKLAKNGVFKYVFTDIFEKTLVFLVERNNEITDLDIQGVNELGKTNQDITITHADKQAKLYVNGEAKSLPYQIINNGKYDLKLIDKYGNTKTYTVFRNKKDITPLIKDLANTEVIQGNETNKQAYFDLEPDQKLYELRENEWKLVENRPDRVVLDKHQTYNYKIVDSFGNETSIKLTVSLEIGEITHNFTRPGQNLTNKPAVFTWQDASIKAVFKESNEPYLKGTPITKEGKHTVIFTDKFNHTKEITFEYRAKLAKIELIYNNQRTVLTHSTTAANYNFKFDTTNDLFIFNKGEWQPLTPNYEFSKEGNYRFKATDKFGNEKTFNINFKRLATIKKEENKLTVIVLSVFGSILAVLMIVLLALKIRNTAKKSPFKQKKTHTDNHKVNKN